MNKPTQLKIEVIGALTRKWYTSLIEGGIDENGGVFYKPFKNRNLLGYAKIGNWRYQKPYNGLNV